MSASFTISASSSICYAFARS